MSLVLQMTRRLERRPELPECRTVVLRTYAGPADIEAWLALRRRAFARQKLGVRDWDEADFRREFLEKKWWTPQAMWIAEASAEAGSRDETENKTLTPTLSQRARETGQRGTVPFLNEYIQKSGQSPIGSVTLARRTTPSDERPVVHWLMVAPQARRHGVARLLMAVLEQAAWDAGFRQVWLETHSAWREAVQLYESLGYAVE